MPGWGFRDGVAGMVLFLPFPGKTVRTVKLETVPFTFSSVPTKTPVSQSYHNDSGRLTPP